MRSPRPYTDPYVAGVALGLVLLASFVFAGRGLGASGAFATTIAAVAPERAATSPYFSQYLGGDHWLLFELGGVIIGGFLSALFAGRLRREVERGPNIGRRPRLALAASGGAVMGGGAVFAGGCTSGLALSGGAMLSVGSWIFIGAAFAAAYLFAPVVRKAWR